MVVSVRGASGLPVGDPVSRKCQPYIILTIVESSRQVRRFVMRQTSPCFGGASGLEGQGL